MDDLISRQAAIDVIEKILPADPMRNDYTQGITVGAALATEYIKQLPSAQPGCDEWCTGCKEYDQQKHSCPRWNRVIKQTVEELKKEQPEIIRCKDCQYWESGTRYGKCKLTYISVTGDYYCAAAAERRDEK